MKTVNKNEKREESAAYRRALYKVRKMKKARVIGVGQSLPEQRVSNDQMLSFLVPKKPNGEGVSSEWLLSRFGIKERRFDYDFTAGRKLSREDGGVYDTDLALKASVDALEMAGVSVSQIDLVVHVTCTPDLDARCNQPGRILAHEMGFPFTTEIVHLNLGCSGLAQAFRLAKAYIESQSAKVVLVVATNTTSAQLVPDLYRHNPNHPWAWLSPAVFADGGGAVVFRAEEGVGNGLVLRDVYTEYVTSRSLVNFWGGGGLNPTTGSNAMDHVYEMDAKSVAEVFAPFMEENVAGILHAGYRLEDMSRVFLHQANGPLVRGFAQALMLPAEKVPLNIPSLGNTSAASTLILLDDAVKAGAINLSGDKTPFCFAWIGAGAGAQRGWAVLA